MPIVEIYTQPFCPYCSRAKSLLAGKGVDFREIDAPGGTPARAESMNRAGGRSSVPQIFIDGTHVGGCDDLVALDRAGKLDALLKAGGMILYALRCAAAHAFDGWFASSAAFDSQAARGLVECPRCGSASVDRDVMAPRIGRMRAEPACVEVPAATPSPVAAGAAVPSAGPKLPAEMRAVLMRLRETVEASCDFVGTDFADQARGMHEGRIEPRGIYGQSSEAEAARLREGGVHVATLPWIDRADS